MLEAYYLETAGRRAVTLGYNSTMKSGKTSRRNRNRLVRCSTHGEMEGYVICRCVADLVKPTAFVEHPGKSHPTLGTILCVDCAAVDGSGLRPEVPNSRLVLVCGFCARDKGLNRVARSREPIAGAVDAAAVSSPA